VGGRREWIHPGRQGTADYFFLAPAENVLCAAAPELYAAAQVQCHDAERRGIEKSAKKFGGMLVGHAKIIID
jgi:hypothetical protein